MKITKAVITAVGKDQHYLPLQTLIDRDVKEKSMFLTVFNPQRFKV